MEKHNLTVGELKKILNDKKFAIFENEEVIFMSGDKQFHIRSVGDWAWGEEFYLSSDEDDFFYGNGESEVFYKEGKFVKEKEPTPKLTQMDLNFIGKNICEVLSNKNLSIKYATDSIYDGTEIATADIIIKYEILNSKSIQIYAKEYNERIDGILMHPGESNDIYHKCNYNIAKLLKENFGDKSVSKARKAALVNIISEDFLGQIKYKEHN